MESIAQSVAAMKEAHKQEKAADDKRQKEELTALYFSALIDENTPLVDAIEIIDKMSGTSTTRELIIKALEKLKTDNAAFVATIAQKDDQIAAMQVQILDLNTQLDALQNP